MSIPAVQIAQEIRVSGQVQGVGFRPLVCRLARAQGLAGRVSNDATGVHIFIQGEDRQLQAFRRSLNDSLPPLAVVDNIEAVDASAEPALTGFKIVASEGGELRLPVTPDAGVCRDCLEELFDPADRRYRYPFINCTNCGPRYTLVKKLPYDRPNTTMAAFELCEPCRREYRSETDRRFHAQPTACADCGPALGLHDDGGQPLHSQDPIADTLQRLQAGQIIAIKGIGGFHLVCDARNTRVVAELRRRKRRDQKPFALMAAGLPSLESLVELNDDSRQRLTSSAAPVVLCQARQPLLRDIAPGLDSYGVMLPHSPLHYLLFHQAAGCPSGTDWLQQPQPLVLVMTSANLSGNPLVTDNQQAFEQLAGLADAFLVHNRDIHIRCDDSVVNGLFRPPTLIRRGRGLAPQMIRLSRPGPATLACGGFFKNSVCLTRDDRAYVSQYIGDLDNPACCRTFGETVEHLQNLLEIEPEQVVVDLHPDFFSSRYGREYAQRRGLPVVAVQHHHAHIAAVMAEHRLTGPVIGLVLDGLGLGSDGSLWGGEILLIEGTDFQRLAHLRPLPLPGGDRASREPWRMAAGVLSELGRANEIESRFADTEGAGMLRQMLERDLNCPQTSSAGRLFDAAAGLLGICDHADYEAQPAMMLESLARQYLLDQSPPAEPPLSGIGQSIDTLPLLARLSEISDPGYGAALLHLQLISALSDAVIAQSRNHRVGRVVLAGGCFLNQVLTAGISEQLQQAGLQVYMAAELPCNDGGISLGQAEVARLRARESGIPDSDVFKGSDSGVRAAEE